MNINQRVELYMGNLFEYLISNCTYEIGCRFELYIVCQTIWRFSFETKDPGYYNKVIESIIKCVVKIADDGGDGTSFIDLIILIVDSIVFNLYSKNKSSDRAKVHHSVYQASSAYQQSKILESMAGHNLIMDVKVFVRALEKLAVNAQFFEAIETLFNYNDNDANKLQLTHFINSLEYILEKEQVGDDILDEYIDNKAKVSQFLIEKQRMVEQDEIEEVNALIFSNKLMILRKILQVKNDTVPVKELHFTIGRLFFAAYSKKRSNFKRRQFAKLDYTGEDMIYNLLHYYVSEQPKREMLFKDQEVNDPIYEFILNYLQMLYAPVFIEFQQLFDQHLLPRHKLPPPKFFQAISEVADVFVQYFATLPPELYNFLSQMYQTIQDAPHFTDNIPAMFPVKNLLISRFLLNPSIKEGYVKQDYNMDYFVAVANLFKDLFYTNTNRSYSNQTEFVEMSNKLRPLVESCIMSYEQDKPIDIYSYFITDPLLRNDYSYLFAYSQQIKILPSDSKEFQMEIFQTYMPKRVIDINALGIEAPQKEEIKKQQTEGQVNIAEDSIVGEDINDNKGLVQGSMMSARFNNTSLSAGEKVDRATQTELQEDDEGKVNSFKQNFDEKSELSKISEVSGLDLQNKLKRQGTMVSQVFDQEKYEMRRSEHRDNQRVQTISDHRSDFGKEYRKQESNQYSVQQHQLGSQHMIMNVKNEEELMSLRQQLEDMQQEFQDQQQTMLIQHKQQEQLREYQITQLTLENNILRNEKTLITDQAHQLQQVIEELSQEKQELYNKLTAIHSEKQVLIEYFQKLDSNTPIVRVKTHKDQVDEFDELTREISNRQRQVISAQNEHEISSRRILRRLG